MFLKHLVSVLIIPMLWIASSCTKRIDPGEYLYTSETTYHYNTSSEYVVNYESVLELVDKRDGKYIFEKGMELQVFDGDSVRGEFIPECRRMEICTRANVKGIVSRKWNRVFINGVSSHTRTVYTYLQENDSIPEAKTQFVNSVFQMKEIN